MRLILCLSLWLVTWPAYCAEPISTFIDRVSKGKEIYVDHDYTGCKIIKIEMDLNLDERTDYLLSSDCPFEEHGGWGNSGGSWYPYIDSQVG